MKRYSVRPVSTLSAALLAFSLLGAPVHAAPNQAVSLVTDFYKTWLDEEGYTVTGRVRILLKPDRIFVQIAHDSGTTRLVFSQDGTEFLGEYTLMAVERDADRCILRILCGDNKDDDRIGTMTTVAFKPPTTTTGGGGTTTSGGGTTTSGGGTTTSGGGTTTSGGGTTTSGGGTTTPPPSTGPGNSGGGGGNNGNGKGGGKGRNKTGP